jgi:hypothetical protein
MRKTLTALFLTLIFLTCTLHGKAQNDSLIIRQIFDEVLTKGRAYSNLSDLCLNIGHRLSGSEGAAKSVKWGYDVLKKSGADTVYLMEVEVPVWNRGTVERVAVQMGTKGSGQGKRELHACSLGGSVGTGGKIKAEIIEVQGIAELKKLSEAALKGKIVFFNRPMDSRKISTFEAYGGCVDQRYAGAGEASRMGAVGVIVRSMSLAIDEHPHTGGMAYPDSVQRIPAMAISTTDAEWLHQFGANKTVQIEMESDCEFKGYAKSSNVIGELWGYESPQDIMVVGGHLDSWDKGQGAHDDGAGVNQSIEVLRLFKTLGIKPKRTLRVILFMNEENGNMGGKTYAQKVADKKETHVLAVESDRGGFTPRGFAVEGTQNEIDFIAGFRELLEPYGLHYFEKGYAGVDIGPLQRGDKAPLPNLLMLGLVPDSQRYFDYHHADTDTIDKVNPRELHLGAGAMAAMIYLLDRYSK